MGDVATRRRAPRRSPAPTRSSTSRRSWATRRVRATRARAGDVNVDATRALVARRARGRRRALRVRLDVLELRAHGRPDGADRRGRRARPGVAVRRAEGRDRERAARGGDAAPLPRTCLRFATVYGAAPRMRFDLTVNEFTRDLWAGRRLEVFGEQFWRPYVHVRDAARGDRLVLEAPTATVAGEVFNVGRSRRELPQARPRRADRRQTGPRRGRPTSTATRTRATTRSASTRSRASSATSTRMTVPRRHRRGHRRRSRRAASATRSTAGTGTSLT